MNKQEFKAGWYTDRLATKRIKHWFYLPFEAQCGVTCKDKIQLAEYPPVKRCNRCEAGNLRRGVKS